MQTGGFALGETSTRSRPASSAAARASLIGIIPICSPSGLITLTSFALIFWLILTKLDRFGLLGLFGTAMLPPPMPELSVGDDSGVYSMRHSRLC